MTKLRKVDIKMKIKDCMCHEVCFVKPDDKIADACKLMLNKHIGCVPVCDNEKKVVGLITDRDVILRSICCEKDVNKTPVSDIMSCNVQCCKPDDDVEYAEKLMSDMQIRRIPIVEDNKIVGILTIGDLAENTNISPNELCNTLENICDNHSKKNAE